jgi:hypothetical protein
MEKRHNEADRVLLHCLGRVSEGAVFDVGTQRCAMAGGREAAKLRAARLSPRGVEHYTLYTLRIPGKTG